MASPMDVDPVQTGRAKRANTGLDEDKERSDPSFAKKAKINDSMSERSVVKASGVYDQIRGWSNMQTPYPGNFSVSRPVGVSGPNIPGVSIPSMPGMSARNASRRAIDEQQKHGPINWNVIVIPFRSMMRRDPIWQMVLGDMPADQVEKFLLPQHEPIFCDIGMDRCDPSVPTGMALCSLRAVNRYLLLSAKMSSRKLQSVDLKGEPEEDRRSKSEKMMKASEIRNRFRLIGTLVNLDNPQPQLPSERAVQAASVTIANTPHANMPNFWQPFSHCNTGAVYVGFKIELVNYAEDVHWTIEDCHPRMHSPFLSSGPFPDQTIHKIRPGGRRKDDVIGWCVIPQIVRNPKGWTDELAVAHHPKGWLGDSEDKKLVRDADPASRLWFVPADFTSGGGAMIYFGHRNHESQGGSAKSAHEVMQMLVPITASDVPKMQQRANMLFDRINVIVKKGLFEGGACIPPTMFDAMYPSKNRFNNYKKLVEKLNNGIPSGAALAPAPAPPVAQGPLPANAIPGQPFDEKGGPVPGFSAGSNAAPISGAARVPSAADVPSSASAAGGAGMAPLNSAAADAGPSTQGKGKGGRLALATGNKGNSNAEKDLKAAKPRKGKGKGKGKGKATGKAGRGPNSEDDDEYEAPADSSSGSESDSDATTNRTDTDGDSRMGTDYE